MQRLKREMDMRVKKLEKEMEDDREQFERDKKHVEKKVWYIYEKKYWSHMPKFIWAFIYKKTKRVPFWEKRDIRNT